MTTTTYTDDVEIIGSGDEAQLVVQGHSTQTVALQQWQDSTATVLAEVREDGRLRVGGGLSLSAPSALIEANRSMTYESVIRRGIQSLGKFTGFASETIAWAVHELQLLGIGVISGIHTTLYARLVFDNTSHTTEADLRAVHAEVVNRRGDLSYPVEQLTALQATIQNIGGDPGEANTQTGSAIVAEIVNGDSDTLNEAIGIKILTPVNQGSIGTAYGLQIQNFDAATQNYAIHTGSGLVHFGDVVELPELEETTSPSEGFIRLYGKPDGHLYAKNSSDVEFDLTASTGEAAALIQQTSFDTGVPLTTFEMVDLTGSTITASSIWDGSYSEQKAFDEDTETYWHTQNGFPHWLQIDFGSSNEKTICWYAIRQSDIDVYPPRTWEFQGSNNGSDWDSLDNVEVASDFVALEERIFFFDNSAAYRYYRWYITSGADGDYLSCGEFRLGEALGSDSSNYLSQTFSIASTAHITSLSLGLYVIGTPAAGIEIHIVDESENILETILEGTSSLSGQYDFSPALELEPGVYSIRVVNDLDINPGNTVYWRQAQSNVYADGEAQYLPDGETLISFSPAGDFVFALTGHQDIQTYSEADVSNPPLKEEITTALGVTPTQADAAFHAIINDGGGGTNIYAVFAANNDWYYFPVTRAVEGS